MKYLIPILCWLLFPLFANAQAKDSTIVISTKDSLPVLLSAKNKTADPPPSGNSKPATPPKPEILSGGFIDFVQNGQMNASARLFRLYIGEPGKFQVPVSIYTGVTANNLSAGRQNEDFVFNLVNPGAGIFNLGFDGTNRLAGKKTKLTSLQIQYQAGFRLLSAYDKRLYKNFPFFNSLAGVGFTFVTGAWERSKATNVGVFWFNLRTIVSNNPPNIVNAVLQDTVAHNMVCYSAGMGIEISQTMNIKVFYFRFINNRDIITFKQPFLQLSFNYSLR